MSAHQSGVLQAGRMCGPYEIVREIGRGGMAVVYLAQDPSGQPRAVKTMQFSGKLNAEQVDRFVREIQLLATIDHVHVVRFFEAGSIQADDGDSIIWVALEYLQGQTLRAIIRERAGRIDVEDVMRWCKHIADGVAAAHELRVVHRDLKPENVSIVHGIAKVFDFGIAKYRRWGVKTTHFKTRLGTVGYMSPEQLSGSDVDERTDVFALGVMLYELASGRHPFCPHDEILTAAEAIARCFTIEPVRLDAEIPGFPEDVARICERAIAKDKAQRFDTMAEMRDALDRAIKRYRSSRRPLNLGPISDDWQVPNSLGEVPPSKAVESPLEAAAATLTGLDKTVALDDPAAIGAPAVAPKSVTPIPKTVSATPLPVALAGASGAGVNLSGSIPGIAMGTTRPARAASPWAGRAVMGLSGALFGAVLGAATILAIGRARVPPDETAPVPITAASSQTTPARAEPLAPSPSAAERPHDDHEATRATTDPSAVASAVPSAKAQPVVTRPTPHGATAPRPPPPASGAGAAKKSAPIFGKEAKF